MKIDVATLRPNGFIVRDFHKQQGRPLYNDQNPTQQEDVTIKSINTHK